MYSINPMVVLRKEYAFVVKNMFIGLPRWSSDEKLQAPSAEGGVWSPVWELGFPHAICRSQKIFFF